MRSNIEGIQFDSNLGITDVEERPDGVWLYVSPGERALRFMHQGIITKDYVFPAEMRIASSKAYILELLATTGEVDDPEIETQWLIITSEPDGADLFDERDGTEYQTVQIGRQTWMAENLAFKATNGNYWTYQNEQSNVEEFGYLYDWKTANNVCPRGWELPSDADWNKLVNYVGSNPGKKLKAKGRWRTGAGTDEFGFTALPGGYRNPNGSFDYILQNGYWWSSTEKSAQNAWIRAMYYNNTHFVKNDFDKADGFSVRCIKIN